MAPRLQYLKAGKVDTEGEFSIEGDHLTVSDICCVHAGVYQLESKTEVKLSFTRVQDDCPANQAAPCSWPRPAAFRSLERVP